MYKQAIIVRRDLEWSKGKLAAQACHASVAAVLSADRGDVDSWMGQGAKKIVLKVDDLKDILLSEAKKKKMPAAMISDAGLTQLPKGTVTALAIGPTNERELDKITGKLKLL